MARYILIITLLSGALCAIAQDDYPSIDPIATYYKSNGEQIDSTEYSAPILGHFEANPSNTDGWNEYYEWRFSMEGENKEPYLIRYEQDTEYTFTESGTHLIVCHAIFTQGTDTVAYTDEWWNQEHEGPIRLTISESKLVMPNAFSPNDDQKNDVYGAKEGWKSIVEFRAIIFNRWGQKIYEWNDPAGGWDGTHNGTPVKEGVYYVDVKAKGSDGRQYHIRRDVNLLRGYREKESSSSSATAPTDN